MADEKISVMPQLASPAPGDIIPIVDISEPLAADQNKGLLWSVITGLIDAGGGGLTPVFKSAAYTVNAGELVFCDSSSAAFTVTLPSFPGDANRVRIVDAKGNASTNNITIARNGNTINGVAGDFIIDQNFGQFDGAYDDVAGTWKHALIGGTLTEAQVDTRVVAVTQTIPPDLATRMYRINNLADDTVTVVDLGVDIFAGQIIISADQSGVQTAYGIIAFRAASSAAWIQSIVSGAMLNLGTGILTNGIGDGIDARLNVSVHTDGGIYIKNRLGLSATFLVQLSCSTLVTSEF